MSMNKQLLQVQAYFETLTSIPVLEWLHIARLFKFRRIKKGEYYVRQGEKCPYMGIIIQGLMYSYYETLQGDIGVKRFLLPGNPVAAFPEVIFDQPSKYSSKALEDTVIAYLEYQELVKAADRHPCWDRIMRKSLEKEVATREQKEYLIFMLSAQERYESFLETHRKIVESVPQYLIASYIGVTPEALSRIRTKRT